MVARCRGTPALLNHLRLNHVCLQTTFFREARPSTARLAQARSIAEAQDAAATAAETRPVHKRSGTVALSTVGRAGFAIKRAPSPAAASIAQQRIASETDAAPSPQRDVPDGVTDAVSQAGLPSATALRKQLLDLRALEASRVEVCSCGSEVAELYHTFVSESPGLPS